MKPLLFHPIAVRRRRRTFRLIHRRSPIAQACAAELALIVERQLSVSVDEHSR